MRTAQKGELKNKKYKLLKQLPPLGEIVRGTFIECYLECIRPNCKCHRDKKYKHGPYYRISYGKKNKIHHIYVPLHLKEIAKRWTDNYNKVWKGIEDISDINIKLIQIGTTK